MPLADQDTVKARTGATSEFRGPGRLIFGRGAVAQLAKVIASLEAKNALIVADRNVVDDAALQAAISDLRANCSVTLARHDGSEPSVGHANQLANEVRGNVDIIAAIGGGSTIDIAKVIGVVKVTEEPLLKFEGADRIGVHPLPLIAIPTTGSFHRWQT